MYDKRISGWFNAPPSSPTNSLQTKKAPYGA
jgi:hypothetical protein